MNIWELAWSVAHTRPEAPFDATLEPPLNDDDDRFWVMEPNGTPTRDPMVFGIIFQELAELDYPYNDQSWPLMRKTMVEALDITGHPSITAFPVVMTDAEIKGNDDPRLGSVDAQANVAYALSQPHLVRKDFSVLRIVPLQGVLELEASRVRMSRSGDEIRNIEEFAFGEPPGGFPPVVRIAEQPTKFTRFTRIEKDCAVWSFSIQCCRPWFGQKRKAHLAASFYLFGARKGT